jgi:hypothetical protein
MDRTFIEIGHQNLQKNGHEVCGDVFMSRKLQEEGRTIGVLSDGLGSGIKANILATMTASMALNFTIANQPVERSAQSIRETLPVDSERKINYASFTIADVEYDGETTILEYGNPQFLIFRGENLMGKETMKTHSTQAIDVSHFMAQKEDRIILFSDGVSQSGIGRADMPFGWEIEDLKTFISDHLSDHPHMSAQKLARHIVNRAHMNDTFSAQDDISCSVIYFRKPRNLLVCSGPPYKKEKDATMAQTIKSFNGTKIICGGTTAQIISRELGCAIDADLTSSDLELPPVSHMNGVDLVTEGILTIGKVSEWLESMDPGRLDTQNAAGQIIHHLLSHDKITFLVGTRINEAHQDPSLPVELEIRRNVIKKIAQLLEEKYLKEVHIQYI